MSGKPLPDHENPEWTEQDFREAKAPHEILPPEVLAAFPRTRGRQKKPTKEVISIRLDRDVVEKFRRTGPGWQSRINDILKQAEPG